MSKLTLILISVSLLGLSASLAQVKETPATLGLNAGGNPRGFVQGSNDQGIIFSTSSGAQGNLISFGEIRGEGLDKLIRFDDRAEALSEARALFEAGEFAAAADAFENVARNYVIILAVPQNFSTEALFYQFESLRRAGDYSKLAQVVDSKAAATISTKLGEAYQKPFEYQKLWGLFGRNDVDGLRSAVAAYEIPPTGNAKLLPTPGWAELPSSEIAQLAFFRATVASADGEPEKALDDYYRAFTLAFGNDDMLAKLAMDAALEIHKADPGLAADNRMVTAKVQSLVYLYSKRFGTDDLPEGLSEYVVRPAIAPPVGAASSEEKSAPADSVEEEKEGKKAKSKSKE